MTMEEYCDWLFRVGTGWLNWDPEVVLRASMSHIRLAHDGRVDMLQTIFGKKKGTTTRLARSADEVKNLMGAFKTRRK